MEASGACRTVRALDGRQRNAHLKQHNKPQRYHNPRRKRGRLCQETTLESYTLCPEPYRSRVEGDKRTEVIGSGRWSVRARGVKWRQAKAKGKNFGTDFRAESGQQYVKATAAIFLDLGQRSRCCQA
jgi:hypothetical protein